MSVQAPSPPATLLTSLLPLPQISLRGRTLCVKDHGSAAGGPGNGSCVSQPQRAAGSVPWRLLRGGGGTAVLGGCGAALLGVRSPRACGEPTVDGASGASLYTGFVAGGGRDEEPMAPARRDGAAQGGHGAAASPLGSEPKDASSELCSLQRALAEKAEPHGQSTYLQLFPCERAACCCCYCCSTTARIVAENSCVTGHQRSQAREAALLLPAIPLVLATRGESQ
ncbi:hypothetical protein ACP70R_049449 [Stipagrostis hirtigluma subsp. patula]